MQLFKRFSVIDDLMYGNTRLKVEKALSDVEDVIGIVRYKRNMYLEHSWHHKLYVLW